MIRVAFLQLKVYSTKLCLIRVRFVYHVVSDFCIKLCPIVYRVVSDLCTKLCSISVSSCVRCVYQAVSDFCTKVWLICVPSCVRFVYQVVSSLCTKLCPICVPRCVRFVHQVVLHQARPSLRESRQEIRELSAQCRDWTTLPKEDLLKSGSNFMTQKSYQRGRTHYIIAKAIATV